jgi:hypothetical protein
MPLDRDQNSGLRWNWLPVPISKLLADIGFQPLFAGPLRGAIGKLPSSKLRTFSQTENPQKNDLWINPQVVLI